MGDRPSFPAVLRAAEVRTTPAPATAGRRSRTTPPAAAAAGVRDSCRLTPASVPHAQLLFSIIAFSVVVVYSGSSKINYIVRCTHDAAAACSPSARTSRPLH